ncbi:MAG: membrane protein insertase YidC [Terricaulis sp.]
MTTGGPGPNDTRNTIIAFALSLLIVIAFEVFYWGPHNRELQVERARAEAQEAARPAGTPAPADIPREEALADSAGARVDVATPSVDGSILLQGARFDDLNLRRYRTTIDETSPEVTLLSPNGAEHGYDAFFGWEEQEAGFPGIGATDQWTVQDGAQLTPQTPLVLHFATGDGLDVTRTIAIDENYMFTVTDEVRNVSTATRAVRPFGVVRRQGLPEDFTSSANVHQGFAGAFGPDSSLNTVSYKDAQKHAREAARGKIGEDERIVQEQGPGGWFGISDHYWLTAIVVDPAETISAYYDAENRAGGVTDFRAAYRGAWRQIPAGGSVTYTQRLFAGAKSVDMLQSYQRELAIPRFDDAVDWGNIMWPLTRPYFTWLLHPLAKWVGGLGISINFAIAILLSTVVIKLLLFPLVYHSYKAMAKLRAMQPKMKEIQERYAADKTRQQQEMVRLYQTEKINPVSGCLPMLLQIPVFFALYKTLSVTIEMRHADFVGWLHDLSAKDPTTIFNLFGLLPFNPHDIPMIGAFIPTIGAWAVLYGVSMWALQALSPPPADPMQARIFAFLPILFTFMFANFPAGMVVYWTWSNTLTILQQYVIMRRQGVDTQLDIFLKKRFAKPAEAANS